MIAVRDFELLEVGQVGGRNGVSKYRIKSFVREVGERRNKIRGHNSASAKPSVRFACQWPGRTWALFSIT